MKRKERARKKNLYRLLGVLMVLAFFSIRVSASENNAVVYEESVGAPILVDIPSMGNGERTVFDFILDPERLLYDTGAIRYGGGRVEEGATLLFGNTSGEYDFSRYSDFLSVRNCGIEPLIVTISAQLTGFGNLQIAETADFQDSEVCSIYLAIIDYQGREQPLSADGEACLVWEMKPDSGLDSYSFGLTGACNPNACWQDYAETPVVTVTWQAEPILAKTEEILQDGGGTVLEGDAPQDGSGTVLEENASQDGGGVVSEEDASGEKDGLGEAEGLDAESVTSSEEASNSVGSEVMENASEKAFDEAMDEGLDEMADESVRIKGAE